MIPLYQCEICHSKILENRLQKHHSKVHPNINDDIYTKIASITSNGVIKATEKCSVPNLNDWGIEASKDEKLIHISCNVCQNRMPAENLDLHMKRKHSNTIDQVDAIGSKMHCMSLDVVEQPALTDAFNIKSFREHLNKRPDQSVQASTSTNPFKPTNSTLDATNNGPVFYTVRVTEAQMQQLLDENRIYPKNGFFHLK